MILNLHLLLATVVASMPLQSEARPAPPTASSDAVTAAATRADRSPLIDGRKDEAAWRGAPVHSGFRQFSPRPDSEPSFRTEFSVVYDDRNLYVFVRAFDPHPDSILRALSRRDVRGPSDQIMLFIDSYDDRRTGFQFAVNPDGVKRDYAIFDDGNQDGSWNGVWDVATAVDSLGWTAEFRIPLSQLRFAEAPSHTFGFGVWRDIERYSEAVSWPRYEPTHTGLVSQLGRLEGLVGLRPGARLEATPYAVTKNVSRALPAGGFERVQQLDAGADLKFGITPAITLDATVNPDFGQVEADPAVLNLSAFETFVSERRPFFVEGTGFYRFPLNCYIVVDCSTNEGLFYSRRIGRSPSLLQDYGDATTPGATPIAFATKLTGRTDGGLSFGALDAFTRHVGTSGRTVEPGTNYAVLRVQQDLRGGDAGIGLIATAVNRGLDEWTSPVLHRDAYVAGASARTRLFGGQYEAQASLTASRVGGTPSAIARTQRGAVHYYQQPNDDLALDTTLTSLHGHSAQLKFGKYGGGITRFETSLVRHSEGFEVNDLGFLRRADIQDWSTWASLSFREPRWFWRWAQFNVNHWQTWNTSGRRLEMALNANGHIGLHNNWNFHAGATLGRLGGSFCDRCTRGGPALRLSRGFYPWFGFNADSRGTLVPSMWVNLSFTDEGRSHAVSLSPTLTMRLSTRLQTTVAGHFSRVDDHSQWFGNFTDDGGTTHHAFAHLDQSTTSMSVRLNYTVTPDLTLEFYGQPFVSSGTYSELRELSDSPDADRYDARFRAYEPPADAARAFRVMQLRTNTVLRWEYRPGSTLFLVWSHGRQQRTAEASSASWLADYGDLLELRPDNTFLVKLAYWLNR